MQKISESAKETLRKLLPLFVRQRLCIGLNRHKWLTPDVRYWWTRELLRDYADRDRDGYHRFLWSNHLAYSLTYEVDRRFGEENMVASRRAFFTDLRNQLHTMGIMPERDIKSVFEVGCSLGYQLRYFETDLFASASEIAGIDIDRYAIEKGRRHLEAVKSKVRLICGDMDHLNDLLGGRVYDIVICTGVLMYLAQEEAARVIEAMLQHSRVLVALSDPGYSQFDNALLERDLIREHDGSRFHNLDAMVKNAGGRILSRRWEGHQLVDGQRMYFVFAQR